MEENENIFINTKNKLSSNINRLKNILEKFIKINIPQETAKLKDELEYRLSRLENILEKLIKINIPQQTANEESNSGLTDTKEILLEEIDGIVSNINELENFLKEINLPQQTTKKKSDSSFTNDEKNFLQKTDEIYSYIDDLTNFLKECNTPEQTANKESDSDLTDDKKALLEQIDYYHKNSNDELLKRFVGDDPNKNLINIGGANKFIYFEYDQNAPSGIKNITFKEGKEKKERINQNFMEYVVIADSFKERSISESEHENLVKREINNYISNRIFNTKNVDGLSSSVISLFGYLNSEKKENIFILEDDVQSIESPDDLRSKVFSKDDESEYKIVYINNQKKNHAITAIVSRDPEDKILIIDTSNVTGKHLKAPTGRIFYSGLPKSFKKKAIIINKDFQENGTCGFLTAFNVMGLSKLPPEEIKKLFTFFSQENLDLAKAKEISKEVINKVITQTLKFILTNKTVKYKIDKESLTGLSEKLQQLKQLNDNKIVNDTKEDIEKLKFTKQESDEMKKILGMFISENYLDSYLKDNIILTEASEEFERIGNSKEKTV